MELGVLGGAYTGRSPNVSSQECLNFYFEQGVDGGALVSTPGDTTFNSDYLGEVRGGIAYNKLVYFVIGNTLYEFDAAGNGTSRGTLATSTGRVGMAHNGTRSGANQQIMIVDGTTQYYIYDNTTRLLTAYDDGKEIAIVWFFDGYFMFPEVGTDRFWITNQYDGTTITGTDFFTAEGDPDPLVSMVVEQRQAFALGSLTLQAYYNSGDADTTFKPFQGGYTQTGCAAAYSAVRFDNSIVWLSRNERGEAQVVRLAEGFQPTVISTPEVNYQLSTYATVSDAFAYVYQQEGHEFYILTFPTANKTWAYDASTQQWHERGHIIDGEVSRERYNCHVHAFGKHLVGDFSNGKIYELDSDTGTANGARIPRIRVTRNLSDEERRIRFKSVQLDMEEGGGDPADTDDTSMWLSWSKNGGHTYSNEVVRTFGDGEYAKRVLWRRMGESRNWVFKLRTWSPKRIIIKGLLGREYGES